MSQLFKDPNQPALFADMNDPVLNATYKTMNIMVHKDAISNVFVGPISLKKKLNLK